MPRPDQATPVRRALLMMVTAVLPGLFAPPVAASASASVSADAVRTVRPGESIQVALDAVRPGGTVLVEAGEYRENLEIAKDGVTLQGRGAVLRPPMPTQPRRCSVAIGLPENPIGICVASDLDPGQEPVPRRLVRDVTVRGFVVRDFPVTGIVIIGGDRTRIVDNTLTGGTAYGLLASSSSDVVVSGNTVTGGDSAGIYIGESPQARAWVFGNRVVGAGVLGIFIRDASHGTIAGNTVQGACIGVGLISTTPARDAVGDWLATGNHLARNNRLCPSAGLNGIGMLLAGTDRITVSHNLVHDNEMTPGTAPWGGGIVLSGGPVGSVDTHIVRNLLHGNQPFDIMVVDPGVRTRVADNLCTSSSPAGLCTAPD